VDKYNKTLLSFLRSLDRHGEAAILGALTPQAVNRWVSEQRAAGLSEEGIASRLSAMKVFAKKYIHEHLELTHTDLLRKVRRVTPPERPLPALTEEERSRLLGCYNRGTYEDVRNRAIVAALLATGLRFREVLEAPIGSFDRISGVLTVRAKGNRERSVRLSTVALKHVRDYLRLRPTGSASDRLWLQADGEPLSYWGGQMVIRRLKERSGVPRIHAHLCRHTFAQVALKKGAERRLVQDMLGHRTDVMARRYAGTMREETAAERMPQYAPI
jgi:integrase/recombinase XerD